MRISPARNKGKRQERNDNGGRQWFTGALYSRITHRVHYIKTTHFFYLLLASCSSFLLLIVSVWPWFYGGHRRRCHTHARRREREKRHKETKTSYSFEMLYLVYMAVLTCAKTAKSPKNSKCTLLSKICTMIAHVEPRKLYKIKIATQRMHFICTFRT